MAVARVYHTAAALPDGSVLVCGGYGAGRIQNSAERFDPVTGRFRVGPSDRSKPAWIRELPQSSFLWQVAGVGGTTLHYYGNSPRAQPGVFHGYSKPDRNNYDRAHEFPFTYRSLIPYYEWVEETLPVQTAPMGRKEEAFLNAAARMGLPTQTSRDITRAAHRPTGHSPGRRRRV